MENGIRTPIQMAVDSMRNLCLGYTGEANAQLIQIDVSKWQEKWPGASIDLMLALPGEKASYPAKTELKDGKLLFLPGYGDTQKPGHGAAYVVATKDGTHLAASDTVLTEIMHKGRGGDELPEAPEAQAGWVANVLNAAHRAEEAAKRAENAQVTDEQVGKAVEDYLQENPVEAPVQSVNGKTGAVQLSAADVGALSKDTPIPEPYTLPTASAEVKGGVKVGSGLQMDGDKLRVKPEGEGDFIETIIAGENSALIEHTNEPDGKPYSFEKLLVKIRIKPASAEGAITYGCHKTSPTSCRIAMNHINTYETFGKVEMVCENGFFNAKCSYGTSGEYSALQMYEPSFYNSMNQLKRIEMLRISAGNGIPAGSVFEVYGVRA